MSGFTRTGGGTAGLDPDKRVNYQLGLVLGEDEFRQDQIHHRERDHQATRALHGYGTVSGLAVTEDGSGRLHVQPGLAVDPAGRLICVPVEYCASLTSWLQRHADSEEVSGALPTSLSVYVVLCWTECETDEVPIPADSCLSAEDSRAASRLKDSFELSIVLEPPPQVGEVAPGSLDGLDALVAELHGLLDISGGSPPDPAGVQALLRDWAVERRPEVAAGNPCLPAPEQACVLLATVELAVSDGPSGPEVTGVAIDDVDRPILVSTRLLQEALFGVGLDVEVPDHDHALAGLDDVELGRGPGVDDVLVFDGFNWVPGVGGGIDDHGALRGLRDDDHPHYLLADGTRDLGGDLSAGGNRLTDLPPANADGQPIVRGQRAGGDLQGRYPDPRIREIQAVSVNAARPEERDAMILRRGTWVPGLPTLLPFVTIERLQDRFHAVWFNIDAPENRVEVVAIDDTNLTVMRETDAGPTFLRRVGPESVGRLHRNVFLVEVREESTPLRFTFELDAIALDNGVSVLEWADENGIWFLGQSADRKSLTAFHLLAQRLG